MLRLGRVVPVWSGNSPLLFPGAKGGLLNLAAQLLEPRLAARRRGVTRPARIYDLRSTFASNALAAGITTFELARIMGTSVKMIEQHYGTLIDTAHDAILTRLEGFGTP